MTEGRPCQVLLLDGRNLELLVQPKLLSGDLLDLVASHFNLKEKEYFGLCFVNDTGQNNWLQLDRKVLEHNFSKAPGPLEIKFLVRFYIEKVTCLKENTTVELFFLNAKYLLFNETIEVESEDVFRLAALALQEAKGNFSSEETARSDLKELPLLPTRVLKEHPSLNYCEERVIALYRDLQGLSRGQAVVQYLTLLESLPTYGVHYYPVKDKQGLPWWLGLSQRGIAQYDLQDKLTPRKQFQWRQLENLYFRERKFAVEVTDPQRRTVTKRRLGQSGAVVHSWYGSSYALIRTIWAMAISQHQFYLDSKHSKMSSSRSSVDLAVDLVSTPRISKLSSLESKDLLIMSSSGSLISAGSVDSEVSEEQKREKISELKKKEKELQEKLTKKLQELKRICLREAELTGHLPKEYPLDAGEKPPHVRRRVGTTFKLDDLFPYDEDPQLRNLESMFALQQKIVEAAVRLASEDDLCKTVRKKRRKNFLDARRKLEEIEKEINFYRSRKGQKPSQRASVILDDVNPSDLSSLSDSLTLDDEEELSSQRSSRSVQYSPRPHHADTMELHYHRTTDHRTTDHRTTDHRTNDHRTNDQHSDSRLNYGQIQEPLHYSHRDALSSHSATFRPSSRLQPDARSMPATPLLTRNAYSSTHLRAEDIPQHFRQRSGSLESESQFHPETGPAVPTFSFTAAPRRSNSSEVLDDGSSYTSHSSVEYCSVPGNRTHNPRRRARGRHKRDLYANSGSMPNLAQPDAHWYAQQPRSRPTTTAYYVTGYPGYPDPEPYSNGLYVYDETEGHYSVNPPYAHATADYHGHYGNHEVDGMSRNPYATLRPPRTRQVPCSTEQVNRTYQKALVAEHLKGWYHRNAAHKQPPAFHYDYDRGSQPNLGYQSLPGPYGQNRNVYASSVSSSGNWSGHMTSAMLDYDPSVQAPSSYSSYSSSAFSRPTHSRSYMDVSSRVHSPQDPEDPEDPEDKIYWHEDSKPGTIV